MSLQGQDVLQSLERRVQQVESLHQASSHPNDDTSGSTSPRNQPRPASADASGSTPPGNQLRPVSAVASTSTPAASQAVPGSTPRSTHAPPSAGSPWRGRLRSAAAGAKSVSKGRTGLPVVQPAVERPEEQARGADDSPGKIAFLEGNLSCMAPSSSPGSEAVRMSIAPVVVRELLRHFELGRDEDPSIFSELMLRESNLDTEFGDAQMIAMKQEAFRLLGRTTVSWKDLLPGVDVPDAISSAAFLIPEGRLTPSGGQRTKHCLSAPEVTALVRKVKATIIVSLKPKKAPRWKGEVHLGSVGPGNKGFDSLLVFLDDQHQAWTVFIQSKQTAARKVVRVRDILENLESDLDDVVSLPQLHGSWESWHKGSDDPPDEQVQSRQVRDGKLSFQRVVYVYVSDGTISARENSFLEQVMAAGHPWLQHTLVLSASTRTGYYSRVGALTRDALRNAVLDKLP